MAIVSGAMTDRAPEADSVRNGVNGSDTLQCLSGPTVEKLTSGAPVFARGPWRASGAVTRSACANKTSRGIAFGRQPLQQYVLPQCL